jgi:transposase
MLVGMAQRDFCGLGRATQKALRARAVYLVIETGAPQGEAVGVSRQVVNRWMQRYVADGDAGLLDGRRLSSRKGKGALTAAEARRVQGWIRDKCPEQLKLRFLAVSHG